ncbi:MAG: hypothetical protein JKX81_05920 [Arenicella sp.]|nr:hypothetical protein [Arenicella sp.]
MKRSHRTVHRILWLLLVPLLLFFVFLAQNSGPNKAPLIEKAPHPSAVGELP